MPGEMTAPVNHSEMDSTEFAYQEEIELLWENWVFCGEDTSDLEDLP